MRIAVQDGANPEANSCHGKIKRPKHFRLVRVLLFMVSSGEAILGSHKVSPISQAH
jgi:hypothetical protein